MAKLTLDLLYPHMNLTIKKVKEQDDGKGGKEGEEQRPPVPLNRLQESVV
jgi:hypothetical protein